MISAHIARHHQTSFSTLSALFQNISPSTLCHPLAQHNDVPPLENAKSMYSTIDSTPLGDVPWQSFTLNYNGDLPDGEVPAPWMETDYNAWYREPYTLIHNIISNPNFKGGFNYAPYQEYDDDGQCHESTDRLRKAYQALYLL